MKCKKLWSQARLLTLPKKLVALGIVILLITPVSGYGQIYLSDHFDSRSDWDGCSDPPSPWNSYFYNQSKYCNKVKIDDAWNDAHGSTGKSVRISWPASMTEMGMEAAEAGGKSSLYIGYWWKHDSGWNWGGDDTHKWIYFPEASGERTMLSFNDGAICFFDGNSYSLCTTDHPNVNGSAWRNDSTWHSYIIYASPANKDIRIWYDGDELSWNGNNLNANFGGSSFDSGGGNVLVFGYQARPDWGSGNVSYFDDTIVASTKGEVESFLGTTNGGGGDDPIEPPDDPIEPPDDPIEPSNTGLPFSDGFESGNFNSWDGTRRDVSVVTANPKAGSYCARARLSQGTTSDNYVDFYYGEKDGKDPVTEIYWQGYSKFDSDYVWPNNAQKIVVHNIYDSQGTKDYQIIVAVNSNGQYYVEHSYWQSWDFFGKAQNQGSPISVSFGQWDKLKLRAKLNTPGNSDGVIQLWINDTLKLSYTNLNIRENTQDTFGKMILSSNSNESSGSNSYQWYDDWSISGTGEGGGPIDSAPAAPTGLKIVD